MSDRIAEMKLKMAWDTNLAFYTSVMYSLDFREGESPFGTAHTDGLEVVIDPRLSNQLSAEQLKWVCVHELRHVTDLHRFRMHGRDPMLWNVACDHAINLDINSSGFTPPPKSVIPICADRKYVGMSAEEIYEDLLENSPDEQCPMPDIQGDAPGGEGDDEKQGQGGSGSTPQDLEGDIKDILIQAVQLAKKAGEAAVGNVPADILRQVDEWLNPKLPWHEVLRKYMNQKQKEDYSWAKPNRRFAPHGLYMPSQYSEAMGVINIYLDASCSVSDEMFSMQVNQFKYIHKFLSPSELNIISFNTRITDKFSFKPNEPVNVKFTGRGGTHIGEVVEHILDNPAEVHLLFTDGYFSTHPLQKLKKAKGDILWCIYNNSGFAPPAGQKVIQID